MATPPTPPRAPAPITSTQPGGGLLVGLALAWGRLRRGFLRRFRPGYVERMQKARTGDCPGCTHDVIDARDLKYFRNVCGHSFPEPARPTRRLPLAPHGLVELVVFGGLLLA